MSSNKNRRARRGAAKRARATNTTALAGGFFLVDAQARHAANPRTFAVPFQAEIDAVRVGDYVKVLVELAGDGGGERFWTWVVGRDGARFRGVVSNHLLLGDEHGLGVGDAIGFEARHILDVRPAGADALDPDDVDASARNVVAVCPCCNGLTRGCAFHWFSPPTAISASTT